MTTSVCDPITGYTQLWPCDAVGNEFQADTAENKSNNCKLYNIQSAMGSKNGIGMVFSQQVDGSKREKDRERKKDRERDASQSNINAMKCIWQSGKKRS